MSHTPTTPATLIFESQIENCQKQRAVVNSAMKRFLGIAAGLLCLWQVTVPAKPNLIFILADDLGYTDLACYGSQYYETPNIDRLAAQGIRFTDGYTCGPNCQPTRAA